MKSNEQLDILVRLLQLEQRFESYSRLYDEEMEEIRETLLRLREDVLKLAQASEEDLAVDEELLQTDGEGQDSSGETTPDYSPTDMSL